MRLRTPIDKRPALHHAITAFGFILAILWGHAASAASGQSNPDGIAVIIGNQSYGSGLPAVRYAANDAAAMKAYVIDVLGFRPGNVIELTDATKAQMEAVFGNASSHEGRLNNWVRDGRSDVFVFYSGHGAPGLKDRRSYILPVDVDPELLEINGYPLDILYGNLARIKAKSITLIMDACFSGLTPDGAVIKAASGLTIKPKRPDVVGERFTVITAAEDDQIASWDERRQQGLFTEYLLQGLYGAADQDRFGNGDGNIALHEIQTYLDEELTYEARRRFGRDQRAMIQGDGNLVLASYGPDGAPDRPSLALTNAFDGLVVAELDQTRRALTTANVRMRPGTEHARIDQLQDGEAVPVTGRTLHRGTVWYRVSLGPDRDLIGFVHGDLMSDPISPDYEHAEDASDSTEAADDRLAWEAELAFWNGVVGSDDIAAFDAYLERYPDGEFVDLAALRIKKLERERDLRAPTADRKPPSFPKIRVLSAKEKEGAKLYREFMGYARDYREEAEKLDRKAMRSSGARAEALSRAAALSRRMAHQKAKMAEGFRVGNLKQVRLAEKRYQDLSEKREKLYARF